ncbi:MAG: AAA family ATPase [Methanothrix sp.]|nr:AAA family ATPase [Methanothrix sp.]OPY43590.1 MAG: protochlorophyllide reductase iron-sulfur ATP-binding protein [Methanosaeta sp. PtaU1.Bin016]
MKRIIFTGKGGVGKTTILSNLARLLARDGYRVLVIDCDPSMNLAMSLGIPISEVVSLAGDKSHLQEKLGGGVGEHANHGLEDTDDSLEEFIVQACDGVKLIVMGTIPFGGAGCLCAPISLVKLLVNYLASGPDENDFIFVDSQAGVEIFGRGLASEFDISFVITEPTPKSLEVAKHGLRLAKDLGVKRQIAIVNKVELEEDLSCAVQELNLFADQILSVGYDRSVIEADKKGALLLDNVPWASALSDILRIKKCMLGDV